MDLLEKAALGISGLTLEEIIAEQMDDDLDNWDDEEDER